MNILGYRKDLADKLREMRNSRRIPIIQKSGKQLAKNLLGHEQTKVLYWCAKRDKYVSLIEWDDTFITKLNKIAIINIVDHWWLDIIIKNFKKLGTLDVNVFVALMDAAKFLDQKKGLATAIIENLEKFEWVRHHDIANSLIQDGRWELVLDNLEKFKWLDNKEMIIKLL